MSIIEGFHCSYIDNLDTPLLLFSNKCDQCWQPMTLYINCTFSKIRPVMSLTIRLCSNSCSASLLVHLHLKWNESNVAGYNYVHEAPQCVELAKNAHHKHSSVELWLAVVYSFMLSPSLKQYIPALINNLNLLNNKITQSVLFFIVNHAYIFHAYWLIYLIIIMPRGVAARGIPDCVWKERGLETTAHALCKRTDIRWSTPCNYCAHK